MYRYLIFNHIPKCAGTSFRRMFFNACYNPDNFFYKKNMYISTITHSNITLDSYKNIDSIKELLHPETSLFIDHSKFNNIENLFNINKNHCYRISCIREPVSRILSHNDFFIKIPEETLLNNQNEFNRLINTCGKLMMQYVIGQAPGTAIDPYDFAYSVYLKEYSFIFRIESLEEDIQHFNNVNPFNLKLTNEHHNSNKKRQNYSQELIEKISSRIPQEIELYNKLCLKK